MSIDVTVIIVTYNDKRRLLDCLRSLDQQSLPANRREILVVDDGSTDGTSDAVATEFPLARLIRKVHGGADTSRQHGVEGAAGRYLAFIDSDCVAPSDWLAKLLSVLQAERVGAVGGRIVHRGRFLTRLVGIADFGEFQGSQAKDVATVPTCNLGVSRRLASRFPFDPGLPAGGDVDFCHRLRQAGERVVFRPEITVLHRPDPKLAEFFRRGARYGSSFVRLRLLNPSVRYAGLVRAGILGVLFAVLARGGLDAYRLVRYRRNAGFRYYELLPALLILFAYRVYSLPSALRALRVQGG